MVEHELKDWKAGCLAADFHGVDLESGQTLDYCSGRYLGSSWIRWEAVYSGLSRYPRGEF